MDTLLLLARLALSAVFAIAGISKLVDLPASRQAIIDFGVPERLAKPLGWLLPIVEIATAVTLLFIESAWQAGITALSLLGLFIIAISVNLARGRKPDCKCFGQVHSAPISGSLIIRNLIFSALALLIVMQGKPNVGSDLFNLGGGATLAEKINLFTRLAIVILLGVIAIFLRQLLKQQQAIARRLEALKDNSFSDETIEIVTHQDLQMPAQGLPIGAPAPEFSLRSIDAEEFSLQNLLGVGKPMLLVFVTPTCAPCTALLPDIEHWQYKFANQLTIVIISKGSSEENQEKFADCAIPYILLQNESEVADAYQIPWTPGAIFVKADGSVASHVAYGSEQIKNLFDHVTNLKTTKPWFSTSPDNQKEVENSQPMIGDPAPSLSLTDLTGKPVALTEFYNEKTMLLFWNPTCSFCEAMLEEVKELQAHQTNGTPKIVIISRGTVEEISRQGLQSPILLDDQFKAGEAFGASGTPSAVLIDAQGRIASAVGVGEREVLALAGAGRIKSAKMA
jgi:peroxiredoxin